MNDPKPSKVSMSKLINGSEGGGIVTNIKTKPMNAVEKNPYDILPAVICLLIGLLVGCVIGSFLVREVKMQAIENGKAIYHPKTGVFTWVKDNH